MDATGYSADGNWKRYAQRWGEKAVRRFGAPAWATATALWREVRPAMNESPLAQEAAANLAVDTVDEDLQAAMRVQVALLLTRSPDFLEDLAAAWSSRKSAGA